MKVLIDNNVLSEMRRAAPEPKVLAWLDALDEDRAFVSVASIAELRRGIALMGEAGGARRFPCGVRMICRRASRAASCRSILLSLDAGAALWRGPAGAASRSPR
jgi:predicted nucleic acid-binding protein